MVDGTYCTCHMTHLKYAVFAMVVNDWIHYFVLIIQVIVGLIWSWILKLILYLYGHIIFCIPII